MKKAPAISVVIPVYNSESHISSTLESLVNQDFQDFETICVDDGSTDRSLEVIQTFKNRLQMKIISRPNTGIVGALNDGIREASASLIARLDSDDLCKPNRLSTQLKFLNEHQDVVVLGSSAELIDDEGRKLGTFLSKKDHNVICEALLRGQSMIHHPSAMMRKWAVEKVGGYREGYCPAEDYDLWLRLVDIGRLANIEQPLIIKRQLLTGLVATRILDRDDVAQKALNQAWIRRGMKGEAPLIKPHFKSEEAIIEQWIWLAIKSKNLSTARYYALKHFFGSPFAKGRLKTLIIVFIKSVL